MQETIKHYICYICSILIYIYSEYILKGCIYLNNTFINKKSDYMFYENIYQELVKSGLFKEGTTLFGNRVDTDPKNN